MNNISVSQDISMRPAPLSSTSLFLLSSDLAMLLRDPYALHVICKSILQCLRGLSESSKLPRESGELECLVRLLQLSQRALLLIDSKEYYEEKLVQCLLGRGGVFLGNGV